MFKSWWNIYTGICCKFIAELASEKNFENRIIVTEVMAKSLVSVFLTYGVHALYHAADRFRCTSVC